MIDTQALRQKILDMAIRGQLVPQDPNDEPASVLLDKIRAEKRRLIKEGKIKKDKTESFIFKGGDNRHYEKIGNNVPICIEDELPFSVPENWEWVRLGCLASIISGVSYNKNDVCESGIRILRGGNITDFQITIDDNDVFLPSNYHDNEKQVKINDIIIVASTGSKEVIGKAGYISTELQNAQIGAFLRIIRSFYFEITDYIKLLFATNYYREHIRGKVQGTNINNIKAEHLTQFIIPVPPLSEQKNIVKYVGKLFIQTNNIQRNQADLEQLYGDLKKKTLDLAIRGKLVPQDPNDEPASELLKRIRTEKKAKLGKKYVESYIYKGDDNCYYEKVGSEVKNITEEIPFDIPENWEWIRLADIVYNHGQKTPAERFNYIDIGSINNISQELSPNENIIEPSKAPSRARKIVKLGDILYATVRPYLHNICIVDREFSCESIASTGFAVMCCKKEIENKYLFYYLLSPEFDKYANSTENAKGVAYPAINDEKLYKALIPLPPLNEQKRIIQKLNEILGKLKDEG